MNKRFMRKMMLCTKSEIASYKWRIQTKAERTKRKILYYLAPFLINNDLRSRSGKRFLELEALLKGFLVSKIQRDPETARHLSSQLLNVLKNCDTITYEEPGTAEAYALLHFLDRYHRFQLIFKSLQSNKLLPTTRRQLEILDVGTGPGPSMYAASDFFSDYFKWSPSDRFETHDCPFNIDYVERSYQFRNWLHHFTEHVNYWCPSGKPWRVPFHHGTFSDFKNIQFNQNLVSWGQRKYTKRHRFDVVVFSNFLTTKDQVAEFRKEIQACARFLRHNGIMIIAGAPNRSKKYSDVYHEITDIVMSGKYSNRNMIARCTHVKLTEPILGYMWSDSYGTRLKKLIKDVYHLLKSNHKDVIPSEAMQILEETIQPSYSRSILWEIVVFRKMAKPRNKIEVPGAG